MSNDYYSDILKKRVQKRTRPLQYFMIHVFLMIAGIFAVGTGAALNWLNEAAIVPLILTLVLSLVGHALWFGNKVYQDTIEQEELKRLMYEEKPKNDTYHRLTDDGELISYDDYVAEESRQSYN